MVQEIEMLCVDEAELRHCHRCGQPVAPERECPLCPECDAELDAMWLDYLAEKEQARRPI